MQNKDRDRVISTKDNNTGKIQPLFPQKNTVTPRRDFNIFYDSKKETHRSPTDKILHHFDTMGSHYLLVFTGELSFQGLLAASISTVLLGGGEANVWTLAMHRQEKAAEEEDEATESMDQEDERCSTWLLAQSCLFCCMFLGAASMSILSRDPSFQQTSRNPGTTDPVFEKNDA